MDRLHLSTACLSLPACDCRRICTCTAKFNCSCRRNPQCTIQQLMPVLARLTAAADVAALRRRCEASGIHGTFLD